MSDTMSPKENYIRAITFDYPHHIPYEDMVHNMEFEGDMMWMGEAGTDRWGVTWEFELAEYLPMVQDHPLKSPHDLDHYHPPEPVFRLKQSALEMLETINREQVLLQGFHPTILFERAWFLMGMEDLLVAMLCDKPRVKHLFRQIMDYQVAIAHQYVQCDIDMIFLGDDYGTQQATMMSPALWRELIKPELARVIEVYKEAGKWVRFHSCGHITEILEDMIEIGVDIINPCQARANDLAEWGERFAGRLVFDGGVDTQYTMMLGSQDEVRQETRLRLAQLGRDPRGGLLLWADQNMPFSEENRQALLDVIVEQGVYPLSIPSE
ncbi:MAG: uroporphyrinogen decarboxylase family protein [Chloroflexota bacterium]|nr:uroporphyrinogen decarboxylase family protein [Chloroflexota bacterium]